MTTAISKVLASGLITMALLTPMCSVAQQQILGRWWSPKKDGQIEVYQQGDRYYGKIVWGTNPRQDTKNPNPALRQRDLMGVVLFSDFKYDASDEEWIDGKIYDPDSGKTYDCKMWLSDNGQTLKVRGYLGVALLGRTEKFERVR